VSGSRPEVAGSQCGARSRSLITEYGAREVSGVYLVRKEKTQSMKMAKKEKNIQGKRREKNGALDLAPSIV
jgi:predicted RNA-binding protein with PIN domain